MPRTIHLGQEYSYTDRAGEEVRQLVRNQALSGLGRALMRQLKPNIPYTIRLEEKKMPGDGSAFTERTTRIVLGLILTESDHERI